ncbi:ABC transporter ATP-binding protein [Streptomyces yaizuensis]|uniref:ABC transporter permease n=1 Tax=Streptomyces yaizuensis TaxID=2989713 RepID=A0ABQ5NSI6_9ACTN|nr:ABC transporter ATP-binding protein [Streptomyces sp. YSPA8]GLF93344.1 ABC transporter permease [Streptomyces sp. YSPA8]
MTGTEGTVDQGARIRATGVGLRLRGGRDALRGVTLAPPPGRITGVAGGSGAGKSLLLETLAGLRRPTDGAVLHDGLEPAAAAVPFGFVPQDDILHRGLTLRRGLAYAARLRGADPAEADRVLAELGLSARAGQRMGTLSGGERKRASIAVELLTRPRLLFLDEPTSGLDPATGARLLDTLTDLAARGVTVVLTTHSPADLDRCDQVVLLGPDGSPAATGTPGQVLRRYGVRDFAAVYAAVADAPGDRGTSGARQGTEKARQAQEPEETEETEEPDAPQGPEGAEGFRDVRGGHGAARTPHRRRRIPGAVRARRPGPLAQWLLLTQRAGELLLRDRPAAAIVVGSPLMIVAMFALLFRPGAFDPAAPSPSASAMVLFWIAFGAFFFGLAYGLLQICAELGVVRRERLTTLRLGPYLASKVTLLLPVLALADALLLVVLRAGDRLPAAGAGVYGSLFVTTALASAAGLALGLLASAAAADPARAALALPLLCFPQVLFSGAFVPVPLMAEAGRALSTAMSNRWAFEALGAGVDLETLWARGASPLGPPLLASYGDSFAHAPWTRWLILAGFTAVLLLMAGWVVHRRCPTPARPLGARRARPRRPRGPRRPDAPDAPDAPEEHGRPPGQQLVRGDSPSATGTRSR